MSQSIISHKYIVVIIFKALCFNQ